MARQLFTAGIGCLLAALSCDSPATTPLRQVDVSGVDYAFQVPDTLPAGEASLTFRNTGKVGHEMAVALLKEGVTLSQVIAAMKAGGNPDSMITGVVGILIAGPGQAAVGRLLVDLLPGRTYAVVCNFQDGPDQPQHAALGMVASIGVTPR